MVRVNGADTGPITNLATFSTEAILQSPNEIPSPLVGEG